MNIIKRFKNATRAFKNKDESVSLNQLIDFLGLGDIESSALSEATYFACLKVLSESIGKLPFNIYVHTENKGVSKIHDHWLYQKIGQRPNRFMNASTFWSTVELNRNHYGNAYVLISGAGEKMQLWILPSDKVEVWYDERKLFGDIPDVYYIYNCSAGRFLFSSEEILHFRSSNSLDGFMGISVQEQLKTTIKGNSKAQTLINRMYDSGFTAKAVLQYTGSLNDENAKKFVKGIEDYASGKLKDQGIENIIPVPLGASITPLNIKLSDNQFVEVKQYSALQIASAFGIKPYQIGDYTKSSYASVEAQNLAFYTDTLLYIIKQYEEETQFKLVTQDDVKKNIFTKMNVNVMLRADFETQIKTLSEGVGNFIYTPNEAREILDLESKPGGDKLVGNGASIPIDMVGLQYTKNEGKEGGNE